MTIQRKLVAMTAAAALAVLLVPAAPAGAEPGQHPAVETQEHPADVFVVQWEYLPATVTVQQGETFKFGNYDPYGGITAHSLDEVVPGCSAPPYTGNNPGEGTCGYPRFSSGLVDHGHVHRVAGVESLPPGQYSFTCQVHPHMEGTLVVE